MAAPNYTQRAKQFQPGEGIIGQVFQTGRPVVIPDVRKDPQGIGRGWGMRSEMAAPLLIGNRVIGVIHVESVRRNAFATDDIRLLSTLALQLAIILDSAQAHRDLADHARQLKDAYTKLADIEQSKDQLVQNLSHELRTPMTFLKGYVELVLEEAFGPVPSALHEPLQIVSQKTDAVVSLVERLINLQTLRSETLEAEPLALANLIAEVADRWKLTAQRAGVEIKLDMVPGLPLVAANRRQMVEALENLLSNAIKFSPDGGLVTIRLLAERESVHVEIADTGIGIPPDKLSKVFGPFYQVDGTTKRHFSGIGVGLALVRQIIEAHGGRVWAESKGLGQGSTFHIALPTVSTSHALHTHPLAAAPAAHC
jgi:signal transduction histidine kinase